MEINSLILKEKLYKNLWIHIDRYIYEGDIQDNLKDTHENEDNKHQFVKKKMNKNYEEYKSVIVDFAWSPLNWPI